MSFIFPPSNNQHGEENKSFSEEPIGQKKANDKVELMIRKINQTELVSVIVDERKRSPVTWQVNTVVIGGRAAARLI